MLIYFITDGDPFKKGCEAIPSPEISLPIVLSFDNYVQLMSPTVFLEELELGKLSRRGWGGDKDIIVILPDTLLDCYLQLVSHRSSDHVAIFVLAVQTNKNFNGDQTALISRLAKDQQLVFQSEIQYLCYQSWYSIDKSIILPLYAIGLDNYNKLFTKIYRKQSRVYTPTK